MNEVELVRSVYARWASGDAAADLFDPDIDWYMPHPGGQVQGRGPTAAFLREFRAAWGEYELEVEEVRAAGDGRVLVLFTERGRGRESGVPTEVHPAALFTVRGGLITRFQGFGDREEAVAALGE